MDRVYEGERLDAMCGAIVDRYHASLHHSLPLISEELATMATIATSPAIGRLRGAFVEFAGQIESHLAKEENLLFPAIEALTAAQRAGAGRPDLAFSTVLHPIRLLEAEHIRIESALGELRDRAREVTAPDTLLPAWNRVMTALRRLDDELHEHHRIENELLFPAALELERQVW
jgi:regulator of cell morphogenesis and NO signaling